MVIADNLVPVPIANPDPSSAILSGEAFGSEAGLGTGTTGAEAAGVVGTPQERCDQQRYRFVSSPPLPSEDLESSAGSLFQLIPSALANWPQ